MLVDVTPDPEKNKIASYEEYKKVIPDYTIEQYDRMVELSTLHKFEEFHLGIYDAPYFDLDRIVHERLDGWNHCPVEVEVFSQEDGMMIPLYTPYGICDSPNQFMNSVGKQLQESTKKYCVKITGPYKKEDEPKNYGLRFHKHGPYVGEKKCEGYEYFVDEPHIDEIYLFHIYQVLNENEEPYTLMDHINEQKKTNS